MASPHHQLTIDLAKNYKTQWLTLIHSKIDPLNKNSFTTFQKRLLNKEKSKQIEDFLNNEFKNTKLNIYTIYLDTNDYLNTENIYEMKLSLLFLNRIFENWLKTKSKPPHKDIITQDITIKAFHLATLNTSLFTSLNKIFKFTQNTHLLRDKITTFLGGIINYEKAKIINELDLYAEFTFDLKPVIITLMIEDRYELLDELIISSENFLMRVASCVNDLCHHQVNQKQFVQSNFYYQINPRVMSKFTSAKLARYVIKYLKRFKKLNLIATEFPNIIYATKLNQLRYLINSKYDNSSATISDDAWKELLIDMTNTDEMLIHELFTSLIRFRDIKAVNMFLDVFGRQILTQLPVSTQEYFNKSVNWPPKNNRNPNSNFFYTADLGDITFVDNTEAFRVMLNYFESNKSTLDVIGMDCEWKPTFDIEELSALTSDPKKNRPNTFQIATRDKCFILETRVFVDSLDDDLLEKFGDLILFSETLIKLGYVFLQDGKKLACSFPRFKSRFDTFTKNVVNLDEVAIECKKIDAKIFNESGSGSAKGSGGPKGLSKLTLNCFGKQLDKRECMSNWENNPLRKAQVQYAAMDAFVLINIHDYLQSKFKELNISYNYIKKSKLGN